MVDDVNVYKGYLTLRFCRLKLPSTLRCAAFRRINQVSKPADSADRKEAPELYVVYDGQCPFCSRYISLLRLRDTLGHVELVDAREGGPAVDEVTASGLDLDDGMVLKMNGRLYHGDECMHRLALLSSSSTAFNRINKAIFRSPTMSRILYPMLRSGRKAVLRMLGRPMLGDVERGLAQPHYKDD